MKQQMCEECGENVGVTNSMFLIDYEESDIGIWVCLECEQDAEKCARDEMMWRWVQGKEEGVGS